MREPHRRRHDRARRERLDEAGREPRRRRAVAHDHRDAGERGQPEREADRSGRRAQPHCESTPMPPTMKRDLRDLEEHQAAGLLLGFHVRREHPRDRPEHRQTREHGEQRRDFLPLVLRQDPRDQRIRDDFGMQEQVPEFFLFFSRLSRLLFLSSLIRLTIE